LTPFFSPSSLRLFVATANLLAMRCRRHALIGHPRNPESQGRNVKKSLDKALFQGVVNMAHGKPGERHGFFVGDTPKKDVPPAVLSGFLGLEGRIVEGIPVRQWADQLGLWASQIAALKGAATATETCRIVIRRFVDDILMAVVIAEERLVIREIAGLVQGVRAIAEIDEVEPDQEPGHKAATGHGSPPFRSGYADGCAGRYAGGVWR
jgi:hypothetical protein